MLYVAIPFFLIFLIILIIALKKHNRHKRCVLWCCISLFLAGLSFLLCAIFEFISGFDTLSLILLILFVLFLLTAIALFLIALLKSRPEKERGKHDFKLVIGGYIAETLCIAIIVFDAFNPFNIRFGGARSFISGAILFVLGLLAQFSVILPRYKDGGGFEQ